MKRTELLRSKEYWMVQIQNNLFAVIEEYMKQRGLNRTELAKEIHVTKSYVTQVLNGDFNHKVSTLVDLSLAAGKVPILNFVSTNRFIEDDAKNNIYELMVTPRPKIITYALPSDENRADDKESDFIFESKGYSKPFNFSVHK